MTTTHAAKTKIRRVKESAERLRKMQDDNACVLIERVRHTLKEGEDVMILSSDGIGFSGFVYGFERLSDDKVLAMIELD